MSDSDSTDPEMGKKGTLTMSATSQHTPVRLLTPTVGSLTAQQAVGVRHAYKNYGSRNNRIQVFIDLNMSVQRGTIYGLLGASGCGKSTLLSCIVGTKRLDKGDLWALGGKPGTKGSGIPGNRVGYMPQELALYGEFTIKETMMFFGWIFGMKSAEIKKRMEFLLQFLELPNENRLVKNLSGGQQRRVSFAVALIHDPELIILDEPTVGVDPVLRQSIWNHLISLTADGSKTIIITTHYIEEARQAHTIGLMRNGELLAEQSPQNLLSIYKKDNLEDVFLFLSMQQASESAFDVTDPSRKSKLSKKRIPYPESIEFIDTRKERPKCPLYSKLRALLQKNFLKLWRNVGILLFIFVLPIMQVSLFCIAIGLDPKDLKIAVVNEEIKFIDPHQNCRYEEGCTLSNFSHFSCRYLDYLDKKIVTLIYYPETTKAIEAVQKGEAWCALYFKKRFSSAFIERPQLGAKVDNQTLDNSQIHTWIDMSNQQIALTIQRELRTALRYFSLSLLKSCNQSLAVAAQPINYKEPVYGNSNPSFVDFVAPGVILTIIFFLAVAITSSALIVERTEGMLDRCLVAGVTSSLILFSHVTTQFFVMCGQTALVLIFMNLVFEIEVKGDFGWIIALTILQGFCGMCFGFVISAACNSERDAIQLALGSFYPILLMSGVIWPIEGMPYAVNRIATYLPLTMATQSLRSMLSRGWDIREPEVYYGFISTIVWIVVFLVICLIVLRIKRS